ncbi:MAG: APC family permease [Candidatus Bathyarchaeia archaeon]
MGKPQDAALKPQLTLFDAIVTGLAAILGAGIFTVIAPAAGLAGPAILISFGIAAFVAFCNASSSIQLAAVFPRSGGTYEFGRRMLGNWWGFIAGWMFLLANTVGPGVSAIAFGSYLHAVWPAVPSQVAAIGVAVVMVLLDAVGIRRSVRVTGVIVILSIAALLTVAVIGLPSAHLANFLPFAPGGVVGILRATGLLFFAYTGYSRIATLVEEVKNPKKTIPRASLIALGSVTFLYLFVVGTAIAVLGASGLAGSPSPLEAMMIAVGSGLGVALVAGGALLTTFNEGLSDLLGVSRVAFAMGRESDLPIGLAKLGAGKNPWRSVIFVGAVTLIVAAFAPLELAVAVSSFGTLLYYSITNVSALKLPNAQRTFPRALAVAGLAGCLGLAFALSPEYIAVGLLILAAGAVFYVIRRRIMRQKQST